MQAAARRPYPKRVTNEGRECAFDWCDEPAKCRGLCHKHYSWELYHRKQGHGAAYWKNYKGHHEELAMRAEAYRPAERAQRKRSSKLRRVK